MLHIYFMSKRSCHLFFVILALQGWKKTVFFKAHWVGVFWVLLGFIGFYWGFIVFFVAFKFYFIILILKRK